ncbi:MAG: VWA domain-containing protein [Geminicoccaceae bacterium]
MYVPRRQAMEVLSISALDIFASALGAFVLIAILMFPYYLKQPSLEAELDGAEAELATAQSDQSQLMQQLAQSETAAAEALASLDAARTRLQNAMVADAKRQDSTQDEVKTKTGEQENPLRINDLDLVMVIDTTKSMKAELADLQAHMIGLINVLHRLAASLRIGIVAFKDSGDAFLTRSFPLRPMDGMARRAIIDFLQEVKAEGGGDRPEPVDEALKVAIDMEWRERVEGRIIVIGDAAAREWKRALDLAATFTASSSSEAWPRRVSTIATGQASAANLFFQKLASAGGGDTSAHHGRLIESILLAIIPPRT